MLFERIESEGLSHYAHLVGSGNSAAVVDAWRDCLVCAEKASDRGVQITHITETHRTEDYVTGSLKLASITGTEIWHAEVQLAYAYGEPYCRCLCLAWVLPKGEPSRSSGSPAPHPRCRH
jgi:hydroxyacylglutathione hydrolase